MFQASLTVNLRFLFRDSVAALSSVSLLSLKQSLSEEKSGPDSVAAHMLVLHGKLFLYLYYYIFLGLLR